MTDGENPMRSPAHLKTKTLALAALTMGAALLAGCGQSSSDQEQAAAAQAAADRAEAAAVRAEKAAGIASQNASNSSSSSQEHSASTNDDGEAVAGPPQPTEEDVQRALDEAGR